MQRQSVTGEQTLACESERDWHTYDGELVDNNHR